MKRNPYENRDLAFGVRSRLAANHSQSEPYIKFQRKAAGLGVLPEAPASRL